MAITRPERKFYPCSLFRFILLSPSPSILTYSMMCICIYVRMSIIFIFNQYHFSYGFCGEFSEWRSTNVVTFISNTGVLLWGASGVLEQFRDDKGEPWSFDLVSRFLLSQAKSPTESGIPLVFRRNCRHTGQADKHARALAVTVAPTLIP